MSSTGKLWGERFGNAVTDKDLVELNCSLPVDSRLYSEDLDGSRGYAKGLHRAGILTLEECEAILTGLELVRYDWIEGLIKFKDSDEDVHTVNERRLVEICGSVGEKLHTGRSRNDQVITDVKLWMKKAIREIAMTIANTVNAFVQVAEDNIDVIFPGYTHLQRAQPVLFSHWLLSHAFALREDYFRFRDLLTRVDVLPLGSGALAGNALGIDREFLAECLGFTKTTANSMHAVGDRDFIVEFTFNASTAGIHLSRLAEDLILYSSKEFKYVQITGEYATGSSLMPQKWNADSLELVRGMSGELFGNMTAFMMTLKGLPSTYNKDLQFDKKALFNSFDSLKKSLKIVAGVVRSMKIQKDNCRQALSADMLATDWAHYLVGKGVPFRSAHRMVASAVALAEANATTISDLSIVELKKISKDFDVDIKLVIDYKRSVEQYSAKGGTSTSSVKHQIQTLRHFTEIVELCCDGPLSEFHLK